jgi:acid stress chaperone HdeB
MRNLCLAVAVTSVMLACPAFATETTIDMSKLTCDQFTKYSDADKGTVMMWLEGYYTEEDEDAVIDFGKMAGHLAQLMVYCAANPTTDIITASDGVMGEE